MPRRKKKRRSRREEDEGGGGGGGQIAPNIDVNEILADAQAYSQQKLAQAHAAHRPTRNIHAHVTKKDVPRPKNTLNIQDSIAKLDEDVSQQVQAINDRLETSTGTLGITTIRHPIPAHFDTMGLESDSPNKGEMSEACLYVYSRLLKLYRDADYDVALRVVDGQPELLFRFSIGFDKKKKEEMKELIEKCKITTSEQFDQFVDGVKNWKTEKRRSRSRPGTPRAGSPRVGSPRVGSPRVGSRIPRAYSGPEGRTASSGPPQGRTASSGQGRTASSGPPQGRTFSGPPPTSSGLRYYRTNG